MSAAQGSPELDAESAGLMAASHLIIETPG